MWALDLGSSNRGLARWDEHLQCLRLWPMPQLAAGADRLGLDDLVLGGGGASKSARLRNALTSAGERAAAQQALCSTLKLWLKAARLESKQRIKDLVVILPSHATQSDHSALTRLFGELSVRVRFLSEPVAAALGYGLTFKRPRRVLIASFGEKRLELVAAELRRDGESAIVERTLASANSLIGTHQLDAWLLEELCQEHGYQLFDPINAEGPSWHALMLRETRRVRLQAIEHGRSAFKLMPPEELREFSARLRGPAPLFELTRDGISRRLEELNFYGEISLATERALRSLKQQTGTAQLDDVLLLGDSALLPGVADWFRARFGVTLVRDDEPLLATIDGACTRPVRATTARRWRTRLGSEITATKRPRRQSGAGPMPEGLRVAFVALQIVAAASFAVPLFAVLVLTYPGALALGTLM
ncbi:MAG: hypothetical protein ABIQ16_22825, partial [Polyangiaceae bacterium]